jgi:plasmid maintenance system killer protein
MPSGLGEEEERRIDIVFANEKLAANCLQERECQRRWGGNCRRLQARLTMLAAAPDLAELSQLPGGIHSLAGDRLGQYAIDLWGPYRLIIEVAELPIPRTADGGVDRSAVTKIRILEVADYHGR